MSPLIPSGIMPPNGTRNSDGPGSITSASLKRLIRRGEFLKRRNESRLQGLKLIHRVRVLLVKVRYFLILAPKRIEMLFLQKLAAVLRRRAKKRLVLEASLPLQVEGIPDERQGIEREHSADNIAASGSGPSQNGGIQ